MVNSINFKGTIHVKKQNPETKRVIMDELQKCINDVQIFNFDNGEAIYVMDKSLDKNILNIILATQNIKFKYYPKLDTKSGFDPRYKEYAKFKLKKFSKEAVTTKKGLLKYIPNPKKVAELSLCRIQEENLRAIERLTFLDLKDPKYKKKINAKTGVCTIRTLVCDSTGQNKTMHTLIKISPPGENKICYAKYIPVSKEEAVRRFALRDGEMILEYIGANSSANINSYSKTTKPNSNQFQQNIKDASQYYKENLRHSLGK